MQKKERKRYVEVLKMKGIGHATRAFPADMNSHGFRILSELGEPEGKNDALKEMMLKTESLKTEPGEAKGAKETKPKKQLAPATKSAPTPKSNSVRPNPVRAAIKKILRRSK